MTKRILSVGDLVVDLITPVHLPILPFQHQETRGVYLEAGGGCNFGILARRMGAEVLAVGAIGEDIFGQALCDMLAAEGIDLRGAIILPGSRTCVVYDLIDLQTREHVFVGSLAEGPLVPYTPAIDALVQSADAVFIQGYNLHEMQLPELMDGVLDRARALGIPVYCDSGPTLRTIPWARTARMLARSDIVLMTQEELPLAADGRVGDDALDFLFGLGAQAVVLKQGAAGCTVALPGERLPVPGFQVEVLDTVGAGDCFDAAFIYGRLGGLDWRGAARLANAAGAACVQRRGAGRNGPTRAEVEALYGAAL